MSRKFTAAVIGAISVLAVIPVHAQLNGRQQAATVAQVDPNYVIPPTVDQSKPVYKPRPGWVITPENTAGLYPFDGEPVFRSNCAACHEPAADGAESRTDMAKYTPEQVYDKIMLGSMFPYASNLNQGQIYGVVKYLTGKSPITNNELPPDPNKCPADTPLQPNGPMWNGWSTDLANTRYQPNPGLKPADVPRLKMKWAFSVPGTKNPQPTVFGDRLYTGSMNGYIYALDAKTGCVHWRVWARGSGVRSAMTVGPNNQAPSGYAVYSGDDRQYEHAYDAMSGKLIWTTQVFNHMTGRLTGGNKLYNGVLYVTVSFSEEGVRDEDYECCTGLGRVAALDANTGKIIWDRSVLGEEPHPTVKNKIGVQQYGPAGGSIWDAPTIDPKRGVLYVGTGNSHTNVDNPASDAMAAMDLKTGQVKWLTQMFHDDNVFPGPSGPRGPDWDLGASPMLITLKGGKQVILEGTKATILFAVDPDTGKVLWQTGMFGRGGGTGGMHFSQASDGQYFFAPLKDPGDIAQGARPGIVTLDVSGNNKGKLVWRLDAPKVPVCNLASGRCAPGYSAAATMIPGPIGFAGAEDGHLRAFDVKTGKLLWDYDTAVPVDTVNGVKQAWGGSIDEGGPVIVDGMVYVWSGYDGSAGENNVLQAFSIDGK